MKNAKFHNPSPTSRDAIIKIFASGIKDDICDALVAMAFYDDDWKWSQDQCLHFLDHPDSWIRGLAAICLGHIARIHGKLDREVVETRLKKLLNDQAISGRVEDALDDIEMFLGKQQDTS